MGLINYCHSAPLYNYYVLENPASLIIWPDKNHRELRDQVMPLRFHLVQVRWAYEISSESVPSCHVLISTELIPDGLRKE